MKLEVNVPEVFEVFKEICAAPEKLFEMMRLNLKEISGNYLTALMEWELTIHLGRKRYERRQGEANHRNGSYPRRFTMKGMVEKPAAGTAPSNLSIAGRYILQPEIFDVLRVPVLEGNPRSALAEPQSIIITESTARKYFGSVPAVGQSLRLELDYDQGASVVEDFQVRGVVRDAPANTHWKYDILISMTTLSARRLDLDTDWMEYHAKYTYLKLAPGADRTAFEKHLASYAESVKSLYANTQLLEYYLQPIRSIHLGSNINAEMEAPGSRYYIYIYSFVALLILLIGVMNYVNLSASLSATRTREVGVRKVAGSRRRDLVFQFLSESGLITLLAFFLSLLFAAFLLKSFNAVAGTSIALSEIRRPEIWPARGPSSPTATGRRMPTRSPEWRARWAERMEA